MSMGAAFNVMAENLRSTLDALSRRSAMAAVGDFATSLSHDVRNALTSIRVDLDRFVEHGRGNLAQYLKRDIPLPALHPADVTAVNVALVSEFLLAKA